MAVDGVVLVVVDVTVTVVLLVVTGLGGDPLGVTMRMVGWL